MSALHAACAAFESPSTGPRSRGAITFCSSTTLKSADSSGSIQNPAWRGRLPASASAVLAYTGR